MLTATCERYQDAIVEYKCPSQADGLADSINDFKRLLERSDNKKFGGIMRRNRHCLYRNISGVYHRRVCGQNLYLPRSVE